MCNFRRTCAVLVLAIVPAAAADRTATVAELARDAAVKAALEAAKSTEALVIDDQVRFCEIPAPPFKEAARGAALRATFQQLGLANVRTDKAGNILADRPGTAARPRLVLAAHLDTVFPEGTPVRVRREGPLLRGPGIGDNCRGLAMLVGIARALKLANVRTQGSITFVADVGEEALGNLRGVKQLVGDTLKGEIDRFVAIDGAGLFLANVAVGSHRYLVTFRGPGGHSFADFGTASPIHAMGRAIAGIAALQVPNQPRATFNVGRVSGGTSVNAIASQCSMEVDLRSSDA